MNIQDLVRQDYFDAVDAAERMAAGFADGSPERNRWLHVAATYRQVTRELLAEQRARERAPAKAVALTPGPQPS